jgi:hypothetical protein
MRPRILTALSVAAAVSTIARPVSAQDEAALKSRFEGKRVMVRIDMPGSAGGIDVRGDGDRTMNMQRYRTDLRQYGAAIRAGDSVTVTLVKVKKDNIEFQLAGGGFGTFGDDASPTVNYPDVEKSNREKDVEKRVKSETDRDRKRQLQRELDDLRNARERENRTLRSNVSASRSRSGSASPSSGCAADRGSTSATRIAFPWASSRTTSSPRSRSSSTSAATAVPMRHPGRPTSPS